MCSKLAIMRVKETEANHRSNGDCGGEGKEEGEQLKLRVPGSLAQRHGWGVDRYPDSSRT